MTPFAQVRAKSASAAKSALRLLSLETRGMHEAAYLLAGFALASQFLALVRDRLLAAIFGATHTLDIYYAAFRVPDVLFATLASLFSLYALLPVLTKLETEGEGYMASFVRGALMVLFMAMSAVGIVLAFLAPEIAPLIAPGLIHDPKTLADLVLLMRILLLQPILLGASNTIASLTQLRHRFVLYSISPLLYNLGIIFGAVVLYKFFGIAGLGWGVVIGALMHLLVQVPYFLLEPRGRSIPLSRLKAGLTQVLSLSVPRTLALAASQLSLLAITAIGSFLASGSIAVFMFAYNLQAVPVTIIGVSYSVAAFPTLSRLFAQGARDEFARYMEAALRHILFWSIPCITFVIVLRAQIVRTILGAGQFDWTATRLTAAALALFVLSLAAQSMMLLIARAYYAAGQTKKPLIFGLINVVGSILLSLALVALFRGTFHDSPVIRDFVEALLRVGGIAGTSVLMLALGYALGAIVATAIGYYFFVRDFAIAQARIARLILESVLASLVGGITAYLILAASGSFFNINTTVGVFAEGLFAGVIGLIVTTFVLYLLKNRELTESIQALVRKFRDTPVPLAVEPTDVA